MAPNPDSWGLTDTQNVDDNFFTRVVKKRVRDSGFSSSFITNFVRTSDLYDRDANRWSQLDATPATIPDLCASFHKIFRNVIKTFGIDKRDVINCTPSANMPSVGSCRRSGVTTPIFYPRLFIFGSGSNFNGENVKPKPVADYIYCASPCEVITEANFSDEVVSHAGAYSAECFAQQGNRRYVYSLVMTESRALLLQFDRNGALRSKDVDIHKEPQDFLYLILLVCSPDCSILGFDTTVYWKGNKRCIKTLSEENKYIEYEIMDKQYCPFAFGKNFGGRGTACWLVRDSSGRRRVIKDAWHRRTRRAENEMLESVKGIKGVCQMIASEKEKLTISGLRGMRNKPLPEGLEDKVFRRLILEAHGKPIWQFRNRKQFLGAFRDAVAGHQNLWDNGILHRDVSINNILISGDDATEGSRGTLIDLDLAVPFGPDVSLPDFDVRMGTRAYQSILLMMSAEEKNEWPRAWQIIPHDYLDDLESFFWVFCRICMGYNQHGARVKCPTVEKWEDDSLEMRLCHKKNFFGHELRLSRHDEVIHNFGPLFQKLFDALRDLIIELITWKTLHRKAGTMPTSYDDIKAIAKVHYARFLELLDAALMDLAKEDGEEKENVPPPTTAVRVVKPSPARSHVVPVPLQKPGQVASGKRKRQQRDQDESDTDVVPLRKKLQTRLETARLAEEKEKSKPQTRSRTEGIKLMAKKFGRGLVESKGP
ncbi:hypothetical protein NLJ89_g1935 [Agrocybe chaxingu]|uniref:Fungal-type protein kinase domain-containing protein n=1 Tax=Agrocybe chaxingu TaxID=84603 RepID=A0A9W8TCK7_9AGAR|nr:hypothetical protein NLJ89_g1935 [Agrocybe chaxingu]